MKVNNKNRGRSQLSILPWILVLGSVLSFGISEKSIAAEPSAQVDGTRTALEKWVETRRLISMEKRDWAEGRQLLEDRIELVKREIESLTERSAEVLDNLAEADKHRTKLLAENEQLKEASAAYSGTLLDLEGKTLAVLKRLPAPLLERLKSLSQRIPVRAEETKLGLSERYLNIVGVLNEVDRFNGEISVRSEVHKLPDGSTAEVAVLYVGLGQAYFVTNDGKHGGLARATSNGWTWESNDAAAGNIQKAIGILKNELVAEYVQLPIQLD